MRKIHKRDLRLRVNAGMDFPTCQVTDGPLDTDKGRWDTTGEDSKVTCKRCLAKLAACRVEWYQEIADLNGLPRHSK